MTPQSEAKRLIDLFGSHKALMVCDEIKKYDTQDWFFWDDVKAVINQQYLVTKTTVF